MHPLQLRPWQTPSSLSLRVGQSVNWAHRLYSGGQVRVQQELCHFPTTKNDDPSTVQRGLVPALTDQANRTLETTSAAALDCPHLSPGGTLSSQQSSGLCDCFW